MKNKKQALAALAADCELVGQYCNEEGKTCALGCLGRLAGYTDYELQGLGKRTIDYCDLLLYSIHAKFGLSRYEQAAIQIRNDDTSGSLEARRRAVCDYVAALRDDDEQGGGL